MRATEIENARRLLEDNGYHVSATPMVVRELGTIWTQRNEVLDLYNEGPELEDVKDHCRRLAARDIGALLLSDGVLRIVPETEPGRTGERMTLHVVLSSIERDPA